MSKFLDRQIRRLERRQSAAAEGKSGSTTRPGSMNRHKTAASGQGKRTTAQIKSDSRTATSN